MMKYHATLSFPVALFACYAPEARTDERVAVAVSKTRDQCTIEIAAADPTSLRATLTTLTKLLGVYEKIGMIA